MSFRRLVAGHGLQNQGVRSPKPGAVLNLTSKASGARVESGEALLGNPRIPGEGLWPEARQRSISEHETAPPYSPLAPEGILDRLPWA